MRVRIWAVVKPTFSGPRPRKICKRVAARRGAKPPKNVPRVVIYNRPDCGQDRLEGCCVKILGGSRTEVCPVQTLHGHRKQEIHVMEAAIVGCGMASRSPICDVVRYVRLEHNNQHIHVQQVEVYTKAGENAALASSGAQATQSSTVHDGDAHRALDGNTDDSQCWPNSNHTDRRHAEWWEVDLGREIDCSRVVIHNRPDCGQDRLEGCCVKILGGSRSEVCPVPYRLA